MNLLIPFLSAQQSVKPTKPNLLTSLALALVAAQGLARETTPNILFILADDCSYLDMELYGPGVHLLMELHGPK